MLHEDRVADLDEDLVLVSGDELVAAAVGGLLPARVRLNRGRWGSTTAALAPRPWPRKSCFKYICRCTTRGCIHIAFQGFDFWTLLARVPRRIKKLAWKFFQLVQVRLYCFKWVNTTSGAARSYSNLVFFQLIPSNCAGIFF